MRRRALLMAAGLCLTGAGRRSPGEPDWKALGAAMSGTLHTPGGTGYDSARLLWSPRFDGVRPPAVATCATASDVAEVMRFARRFGLGVTARGGGHSYVGASSSGEAIVVDTRPLDTVTYQDGVATVGGGARLLPIYESLAAHGVSIPSGSCGTVGVGGIALGGGIGMASRRFGLTCDAVTGVELVTADGTIREAGPGRDADLFWACRGGGGGQVGVVTRYTMTCFPVADVGSFVLAWPWADAAAVMRGWQERLAPDHVWSTLQFASDRTIRLAGFTLGHDPRSELDALVTAAGRDPHDVSHEMRPYLEVVRDRAGRSERAAHLIGSDILPGPLPAEAIERVLKVVEHRTGKPGAVKFSSLTGAVSKADPEATAFPWRGAFAMAQWLVVNAAADDAYAWIGDGHRALAGHAIGRYVNYLEPGAERLDRYYGRHYERLRAIRRAADPDRRFRSPFSLA